MGWDLAIWGKLNLTASAVKTWEAVTIAASDARDLPDPFGAPRRVATTTVRDALDRAVASATTAGEPLDLTPMEGGLQIAAFLSDRAVLGEHVGFWIVSALRAAAAPGATGKIILAGYGTGTSWELHLKGGRAKLTDLGKDLEGSAGMRRVLARLESRQRQVEEEALASRIAARSGAPPDASALASLVPGAVGSLVEAAFARLASATKVELDAAMPKAWVRWGGQGMAPDRFVPASQARLGLLPGSPSISQDDRGTLLGLVAAITAGVDGPAGEALALALLASPVEFTARVGALNALGRVRSDAALEACLRYLVATDVPGAAELPSHARPEMRFAASVALSGMDRPDVGPRLLELLESAVLKTKTLPRSTARGSNATLERNQVIELAASILRLKRCREALACLASVAEDDSLLTNASNAAAVAVVALTTSAEHEAALGKKGLEEAAARYDAATGAYDAWTWDFGQRLVKAMRERGLLPASPKGKKRAAPRR